MSVPNYAASLGQVTPLTTSRICFRRPEDFISFRRSVSEQRISGQSSQHRTRARSLSVAVRAKKEKDVSPYKNTINLPQTSFNLRANAKVREPELHKMWEKNGIYERLYKENPGEIFTLHDGPPYANGDLHIGHALNKILKDVINRYQTLQGRKVRYVPGWDCHGLPIELKVLQTLSQEERAALTPIKLRQKAAKFARKTVNDQKKQFMRYGIWADWEDPYMTLLPEYEAAQIDVFGKMVLNGHIYRGKKPVNWSPSSRTALAEAELEYPAGHTSRSIYVAMPVVQVADSMPEDIKAMAADMALAIWTTTPWTIPANAAVAVNSTLTYVVVEAEGADWPRKYLVVGKDLVEPLQEKWGAVLKVVGELKGGDLEGTQYKHPLFDRESPVVMGGDYITFESGTGLVHTAPGHGQDDYITGMKYGLPMYSPVDDEGNFTDEATERFQGLNVLGEGNTAVIEALEESKVLLLEEEYAHKYPYDWRTKKPTIFRATEQWFASVEGFRQEALDAIKTVDFIPASGERRITSMTEGRNDWCISRQRTWGVPIPVFYNVETGEPLMTEETIKHIQTIVAEKGTDAWFYMDIEDLLPDSCKHLAPTLKKGMDTMDVWFDSGSSWAAVVEGREGLRWPADLYLEGSDQHRGWFQSSLLTGVAARGSAPYKQVLTHGFVLDEKGFKMSKSLGNVIDPRLVIEGGKNEKKDPAYGADVLRLWVASVDYTSDVLIGTNLIKQTFDSYRKLRNTMRYLLGNTCDFNPSTDLVPYQDLPAVDRLALARLAELVDETKTAYDQFQFYRVFQAVTSFNTVFLSNFYLDQAKDRLYIRAKDDPARRTCQTVLHHVITYMMPMMAPVLPHMMEDVYLAMPHKEKESVFEAGWHGVPTEWATMAKDDQEGWEQILAVRAEVNKALERARVDKVVGAGLDAKVVLHATDAALAGRLASMVQAASDVDELRYIFIVSQVETVGAEEEVKARCPTYCSTASVEGAGSIVVGVVEAEGIKSTSEARASSALYQGCPGQCDATTVAVATPSRSFWAT
ncbi:hypothetical protein CYMTET_7727 [Cymbomonas tetramitiformis]|uniref:isoleucine--tRNA ligase n=1 Tax=Cymbomonas tetramitiformis TaxID=36881 RepID=A0AAE0GUK8_9CHLO|nr:hypothetical protein CYMTET_7727 [Cymbomonas tetramitiformis]